MAKKTKPIFTTVFLALLLLSSVCISLIPNTRAEEVILQDQKISRLNNVVGLDTTKYTTTTQNCPQDFYMDIIPQENILCYSESNTSKVKMLYTFANGNLRMIHVLESDGTQHLTGLANDYYESAENLLSNYQSYTGNTFYTEIKSMLNSVAVGKNSIVTSGNIKLEVVTTDKDTTFRWTYTINGIEAPTKTVALRYTDGFLKYFIDNWNLHKIGSTTINLSEKEAMNIAQERSKNFSWTVGSDNDAYEVKNFNVTQAMIWETIFCSDQYADEPRSQDPLTLYPMRQVWVSLDKFYPGNVYGIEVYIWADTGKIGHIQERFSTLLPEDAQIASLSESAIPSNSQASKEQLNSQLTSQIALPTFAVIALGMMILFRKKHLPKQHTLKISGFLLCLLIASTLLVSVATVSADPRRRATVWGSESTGMSGRKTTGEIAQQRATSQHISDYFKNDAYLSSNYQGSSSIKSDILDNIWYNERNYDRVAVLDFDHGVGRWDYPEDTGNFHYMFEDNIGKPGEPPNYDHLVFDMDVADQTIGKSFLVFINTCMSANLTYQSANGGNIQGMPYAWTERTVHNRDTYQGFTTTSHISDDAYNRPDTGAFCYLGFSWGSAALDQTITAGYPKYYLWIEDFFYYALSFEMTVNEALDHASNNRFGEDFDQCDLYDNDGFTAIWPMDTDGNGIWEDTYGYNSHLAVYGNGNIRLYEYFVHYPYYTSSSSGSGLVSNQNGFTGAQPDASYTRLRAINVNDQAAIIGSMGYSGANLANGHIWVYGYSSSYTSRLRVYASYYSDSGWQSVGDVYVSPGGARWIDCGNYASNFRYISFAVYRQSAGDYSNDIYLDNIVVLPPLPNP